MSAPEQVTEEEWHSVAEAHKEYTQAHKEFTQAHGNFLRLALLRAQSRGRENTRSLAVDASSVDDAGNGPTTYTSFSHNIRTEAFRSAVRTVVASGNYDKRTKDLQDGVTVLKAWQRGMANLKREESEAEDEKNAAKKIGKKLGEMARGSGDTWTFFTVYEMAYPLDDPCHIKDASSSSQGIGSGQPQGGKTLAELRGDKTRALEEYERLVLVGPQRLVRGKHDTDVPEGYYELGEGVPFPVDGRNAQDHVAVLVDELYDFEKMSLVREDEDPAYNDWPEVVQVRMHMFWPTELLLPPLLQKVTRPPRTVNPERRAELAEKKKQASREEIKALKKKVKEFERQAGKGKRQKPKNRVPQTQREHSEVRTAAQVLQEEQKRRRTEMAMGKARVARRA